MTTYLFYFLKSQFDFINSNTRGTGIPHVDPEIFNNLEVPLAPLDEQKRIVGKLEKLLGKFEVAQARLDKIPAILKRFRQAILAAAYSGKLTAGWRAKNQNIQTAQELLEQIRKFRLQNASTNKEISQDQEAYATFSASDNNLDLPSSWISCFIGTIGTVSNGSTPSRKVSNYWNGNIH